MKTKRKTRSQSQKRRKRMEKIGKRKRERQINQKVKVKTEKMVKKLKRVITAVIQSGYMASRFPIHHRSSNHSPSSKRRLHQETINNHIPISKTRSSNKGRHILPIPQKIKAKNLVEMIKESQIKLIKVLMKRQKRIFGLIKKMVK